MKQLVRLIDAVTGLVFVLTLLLAVAGIFYR